MNRGKETASRRRTIAVSVPLTGTSAKEKPSSNNNSSNSITSFFFGQKNKSNTAIATVLSSKSSDASSKSNTDSGKLARPSSGTFNLFRANSNRSVSSAVSNNSVSSKGSFRGSTRGAALDSSPTLTPTLMSRTMSSNDELDKAEHMAISVSMKLNLWEATDTHSPKSASKQKPIKAKRSLNRDNSTGSNISNVSNISNNSNISILSNISSDSHKSNSRAGTPRSGTTPSVPQPFNAAAAAAASRERFFGTSSPTPSMIAEQEQAHAHTATLASASHELMMSSAENSPAQTPRPDSNSENNNPNANVNGRTSPSPPRSVADAQIGQPVQQPLPVKPSLKKITMEALPNRREGLQRARSTWVQTVNEGVRPKMVKFTSSTKSMGELLSRETSREGKEALIVSAFMLVPPKSSPSAPHSQAQPQVQLAQQEAESSAGNGAGALAEDIFIEGATIVEETDDEAAQVQQDQDQGQGQGQGQVEEQQQQQQVEQQQQQQVEAVAVEAPTIEVDDSGALSGAHSGKIEDIPEEVATAAAPSAASPVRQAEPQVQEEQASAATPTTANPVRVALRHTTPGSAGADSGEHGSHAGSQLVLPSLSPVPVTAKVVTPARVEFVEVKLKHAESSVSVTGATAAATEEEKVAHETTDAPEMEQPHASLQDPRVPLSELVRRNACKQYEGLCIKELEVYLSDEEFTRTFRMTRADFYQLPLWRQHNQKRSVGLF